MPLRQQSSGRLVAARLLPTCRDKRGLGHCRGGGRNQTSSRIAVKSAEEEVDAEIGHQHRKESQNREDGRGKAAKARKPWQAGRGADKKQGERVKTILVHFITDSNDFSAAKVAAGKPPVNHKKLVTLRVKIIICCDFRRNGLGENAAIVIFAAHLIRK